LQVFFREIFHHFFFESLPEVDYVVRDPDLVGYPAGIPEIIRGAATAGFTLPVRDGVSFAGILWGHVPKVHGQADDLVPFFF
jgi:hypothetical protein